MCPYEPRTQDASAEDGAGVTVPIEPQLRDHTKSPAKKTRRQSNARRTGQNLVVRGVRRDPPDIHKLAQVLASLAAHMVEDETGDTDTEAPDTAADQETPRRAA